MAEEQGLAEKRQDIKKKLFLEGLAQKYSPTAAAAYAGIARQTAYKWRDQDPDFAKCWDDSLAQAVETLEQTVYERALRGADVLAIFLLKGAKPEKYRDQYKADVNHTGEVRIRFAPEEKDATSTGSESNQSGQGG